MPVSAFLAENQPVAEASIPSRSNCTMKRTCNTKSAQSNSSSTSSSKLSSTASCSSTKEDRRKDWNTRLSLLFPDLADEAKDNALLVTDSIMEAADSLLDKMDRVVDVKQSVLNEYSAPPPHKKTLDSFLIRFRKIKERAYEDYEELSVSRNKIWRDCLKYYKRKVNDTSVLKKTLEFLLKEKMV